MIRILLGIIILVIGIGALTGINLFKYVFAFFLILLGISIITGRSGFFGRINKQSVESKDFFNEVSIFSPVNKIVKTDNFTGGQIVMIFSGGEIDLRLAKTKKKNIDLEVITVFGGGKIIVPKDWIINLQGTAIIGGYDNKTSNSRGQNTLNIKGITIFGGLEIVN
jgi:predicted membrane protein